MSHPVLDLTLFRIRNFAVTNIETLIVYAGLIGALFFVTLFLQQTAGYSPIEAGLATTPVSLLLFVLSPRFGKFATGTGPRLPMAIGPIVAGCGLLVLLGVGADVQLPDRGAAGAVAVRTRSVRDGRAPDGDRAQLGRGASRRRRLRDQQRRLPCRRAARDRGARRPDRRASSVTRSTPSSRGRRSPRRGRRRSTTPRRTRFRHRTPAGCRRRRRARSTPRLSPPRSRASTSGSASEPG